ncbi:MAG: ThiF family adenylyltransferase [Aigarchaeota archaeon]|nr:ThiF family adenylyltransferase [Aigarchaeota archaeon]MCX8192581.1 ThiF family adenylyltransferase [Nitrososphaeria archaeon]MDW7985683.1 ThiF family adenylyltransferase [Nitrososphaerota archaeon]
MRYLERYERQLRIEGWDQDKLSNSTVMIVGVGAIGCEIAKNLTLMGVGELILVDNDVVEVSNLSRQMLFTDKDIGRPKTMVARERLVEMNQFIKIRDYYKDVRELDNSIFEEVDIICSCLDNWPVRRWVNSMAVELDIPLIDAAMDGLYANLQVVLPGKTACLECHGETLIPREVQLAECTLRKRKPEDLKRELEEQNIVVDLELVKKLFEVGIKTVFDIKYSQAQILERVDEEVKDKIREIQELLKPKMPALQSVAAAISGLATTELVKILHGESLGKIFSGLIVYDGYSTRFTRVKLDKNKVCFVCGDYVKTEGAEIKVKLDEKVIDLKKKVAERFSFPDPEILYKKWRLEDDQVLREIGIRNNDIVYVETSRRFNPLPLKILLVDTE